MIKIDYELISSPRFAQAMHKLGNTPFTNDTSMKINKIVRDVEKCLKTVGDQRDELIMKHATKDKDGNVDLKAPNFEKEVEEVLQKEMEVFFKKTISFDRKPLKWNDIRGASFTASELRSLEPLYTEISVIQ